jgi:superfamily II RNA helicase
MSETAPLAALLPAPGETLGSDEILSRFVGWVAESGLSLYPAQEEAILELLDGKHVILNTPTGSGKSLVATALHFQAMARGAVSYYTCPIKALVNEKFFALCQAFGPDRVGMLTGDASINKEAPILCCTAEILANLVLREAEPRVDVVIMDEFHYYSDKERGVAWQVPLLSLPRATFLLMSATLGDVKVIEDSLKELTGKAVAVVRSEQRPVPLDFSYKEIPLHETIEELIKQNRAPIYLVNFTQRAAAEQAQSLMSVNFSSKEEKESLRAKLQDVSFDTPYGSDLQKYLRHGIGLHHAGLLPKYRLTVEKLAQSGLLKVVSGTDTLGVGVNIPIRTVLFTQLCKFDGEKVGILSVRDFKQIAGRAGRKGFDDRGSVVVQAPEHVIENLRLEEKRAAGKKVVKRQPPQKGYAHWDRATFERLMNSQPEPLESRFEVSHGLLLNLLQSTATGKGGGYRRLVQLIARSHGNEFQRRAQRRLAKQRFKSLREAGIVLVQRDGKASRAFVSGDLQRDFSLNHTLSLYLIDTLARLERSSENYALDVITLVESILENPQVVLLAQLSKLKGELVDRLKSEGVEYEQRMEELDKLEWPKPNRDFIYDTFNAFAAKHPWVGQENIRPKSIARELFESFVLWADYIRDYGLQRSEGVLLRYLSQVWKTLVQTVPEADRTDEVEDVIAHLGTMLRGIDSSLIDEWESMRGVERNRAQTPGEIATNRAPELADDPRALLVAVRAELHRFVFALSKKEWAAAAAIVQPGVENWTADKIAAALQDYFAEHATIVVTPSARSPRRTVFKSVGPKRWEVQQTLVDPEGDDDWMVKCEVDLTARSDEKQPLCALLSIGI